MDEPLLTQPWWKAGGTQSPKLFHPTFFVKLTFLRHYRFCAIIVFCDIIVVCDIIVFATLTFLRR
jgi:hypothetical protein